MARQFLAYDGKTVAITGGASGIGLLLARGCALRGANVVIWDYNEEGAKAVAEDINKRLGASIASYRRMDVRKLNDMKDGVQALEENGGADILINCAGVVTGKAFEDISTQELYRTMEVNAIAPFQLTQLVVAGMEKRGRGKIVTIASAAGTIGVAQLSDYCASKFAAVGFMESLRMELKSRRSPVKTLTVCPYFIATGMFEGVRTKIPWLLPIMKPENVANNILHAIETGREVLVMPPFARFVPALRLLPTALMDMQVNFFGINNTMDFFTGRKGSV